MSKIPSTDTLAEAVGSPLPGLSLQQAREKKGLSLEEVSNRIKISVAQLDALERGDIQVLPGLAFARGYVRTYGRLLELDADVLVRDFNALYGGGAQRPVKTINRVKPQAHLGDPMIRVSVVVFVLILFGSSIWWWQTQMGGSTSLVGVFSAVSSALVAPEPIAKPEEGIVEISDAADTVPALRQSAEPAAKEADPEYLSEEDIARLAKGLEKDALESTAADVKETVLVAEAENAAESEEAVQAVLMIRFSDECWVSIKDASGKVIFASLMQEGNTLERNLDSLPVELLIGQASAVAQSAFRGQPLDLALYTKKGVARLTLE